MYYIYYPYYNRVRDANKISLILIEYLKSSWNVSSFNFYFRTIYYNIKFLIYELHLFNCAKKYNYKATYVAPTTTNFKQTFSLIKTLHYLILLSSKVLIEYFIIIIQQTLKNV